MKFKKVRTVAGLLLQLVSFHAHAEGEGAGNPFPFGAPAQVTAQVRYAADAAQDRFPDLAGRLTEVPAPVQTLAVAGSEAPFLSAASVPVRFDEGTVALTQVRGLERYQAARRVPVQTDRTAVAGR